MTTPRILLACSGLGHVRRGNEAWARDAATALHQAGLNVTLAGGGPNPGVDCSYVRLFTIPRGFPLYSRFVSWSRRYLIEQLGFVLSLRRYVRRQPTDIVHFCDPDLALQFTRRTRGWPVRTVFKDGMLLGPHWCSRMPFVQVLAPYYRDVLAREAGVDTSNWFVIPHLIDTKAFQPPVDREAIFASFPDLKLTREDFVVLGVGDFSVGGNKRLRWLVQEVASLPRSLRAHLVLAGQADPAELQQFATGATAALGDRVHLLPNQSREQVSRLYGLADVFAHAATREPFGIVFLEAMASGLPIAAHTFDVTQWIIGDAGTCIDMTVPGALTGLLEQWGKNSDLRRSIGSRARARAVEVYAPGRIVPLYQNMYSVMMQSTGI